MVAHGVSVPTWPPRSPSSRRTTRAGGSSTSSSRRRAWIPRTAATPRASTRWRATTTASRSSGRSTRSTPTGTSTWRSSLRPDLTLVRAPAPATLGAMADREAIAVWRSRLRWRLSGAWQWPAFAVLVVVDAVVLARLPFAGGRSTLLGSLLAAGLLNVIVLAVVARPGGWLVRRRRPDLPREVAADFAGTAGLVALCVLLIVGGVLHRPALREADTALETARSTARAFASHQAPHEYL